MTGEWRYHTRDLLGGEAKKDELRHPPPTLPAGLGLLPGGLWELLPGPRQPREAVYNQTQLESGKVTFPLERGNSIGVDWTQNDIHLY